MNGAEAPSPLTLTRGVKYRLRLINMAPELAANFSVSDKDHPATWHAIAKDGATLPTRMAVTGDASLHIASGETYDFEFQPEASGELSLQVENAVNKAKLTEKIVVQ
jgi:FtsP/CotA-like multicopper oxidase with cupredoxin domain